MRELVGSRRRLVGALGALALVLGVLVGWASPARAATPATISGTVTGGGSARAGIQVTVYGVAYGNVVGSATTDAAGTYQIVVPAPANVRVAFRDPGHTWADQWNGGAASFALAATISLASGQTRSVGADLVPYVGSISGTVTDDAALPIGGVVVEVSNSYYGNVVASVTTAADGSYQVPGLPPVAHRVRFADPVGLHTTVWNGGAPSFAAAPDVTVVSGTTVDVDATLLEAGIVYGRITNGGRPLAGAYVLVLDPPDDALRAGAITDADGRYRITGVGAGPHKIGVVDPLVFSDPTHARRPQLYPRLDVVNLTLAGALAASVPLAVPGGGSLAFDADLEGSQCAMDPGAVLPGVVLSGADLSGCELAGSDLSGAVLAGTALFGADLRGADLRGAAGTGADFSGARLLGARLEDASLTGADFTQADLRGAVTSAATQLAGAVWADTICPDGTNSVDHGDTCLGHLIEGPVLVVDSTVDAIDASPGDGTCATAAGECTLRAAVQEANAGPADRIVLQPEAVYPLDLVGSGEQQAGTGDLDVTAPVTLYGLAATVDAGALGDRVFDVIGYAGNSVTLQDLTITGGATPDAGGGILSSAHLTLDHVAVLANHASSGGGISTSGTLDGTSILVSGNQVASAYGGSGGGIDQLAGTSELHDAVITANAVQTTSPGSPDSAGAGGGLSVQGGSATLVGGAVDDNEALGSSGIGGGGVWVTNATISLDGTHVGGNRATIGGALRAWNATLSLADSVVEANPCPDSFCATGTVDAANSVVTVERSTIDASTGFVAAVSAGGGGVGSLTVTDTTIRGPVGEGIYASVATTVARTTITGATSAGVHHTTAGSLVIENSTIAAIGSAAYGIGVLAEADATLRHSTVAGSWRSVMAQGAGLVHLEGSILQHAGTGATRDCTGPVVSSGGNVVLDATCDSSGAGDQASTSAVLGSLGDHGGFTATMIPDAGSPAIDAAGVACAVATDQRGVARPQGGGCDAGAVEQ